MKFLIKNLGPIKEAEIEPGDLTIICGKNNTGKTYLTYTLSTFFDTVTDNIRVPLPANIIDELLQTGVLHIELENYICEYIERIKKLLPDFTNSLPRFLAMHPDRFRNTDIQIDISKDEIVNDIKDGNITHNVIAKLTSNCSIKMIKDGASSSITILLLNQGEQLPKREIIEEGIAFIFAQILNGNPLHPVFPKAFVITCERTGAALFRTELIISSQLSTENNSNIEERKQLNGQYEFRGYQRPVGKDLKFVIHLKDVSSEESEIQKENSEIISLLSEIVGGKYILDEDTNQVKFMPEGTNESLALAESSSTVRALMELNFYLRHKAQRSQMFVFDEPELNLHPENQRKIARLLAMLVNAGIRVLITTHSDYIIKEFNTLLMLNYADDPRMPALQKKYGYTPSELLKADQLRVYCVENGKSTEVKVSQDVGIGISSFDENIRAMGKMQRDILYGGKKNA